MKKYPIGFNTRTNKEPEESIPMEVCKGVIEPKKSIVQVYFPHRGMGCAYYNDSFDLKVGDFERKSFYFLWVNLWIKFIF